jgi:hypothetical protein
MKKIFFAAVLLLAFNSLMSQTGQSLPEKMTYIYAPLDKSQLLTGYLYNQSPSVVSPARYRGTIDNKNATDINQFGAVFGHIYNSKTAWGNS